MADDGISIKVSSELLSKALGEALLGSPDRFRGSSGMINVAANMAASQCQAQIAEMYGKMLREILAEPAFHARMRETIEYAILTSLAQKAGETTVQMLTKKEIERIKTLLGGR